MNIIELLNNNNNDKIIEYINKDTSILLKPIYKKNYLIFLCVNLNKFELLQKIIEINPEQLLLVELFNIDIIFNSILNKNIKITEYLIDKFIIHYIDKFNIIINNYKIIFNLVDIYEYDEFVLFFNKYYEYLKNNTEIPSLILYNFYDKDIFQYLEKFKYINNKYFYNILNLYFDKKISIEFVEKFIMLYPEIMKFNYENYNDCLIHLESYIDKKIEYIILIKLFIKLGLNYNVHYNYKLFINEFIKYNYIELINILLEKDDIDKSINYIDYRHQITLSYALIYLKDTNIIKKIINLTNDMNLQNIYGNTPLHFLFKRDDYLDYYNDIKNKKINLYIKNKLDNRPIDNIKKKDMKIFINKYIDFIDKSDKSMKQLINKCKNKNKCHKFVLDKIKKNYSLSPLYKFPKDDKYDDIKIIKNKNVEYSLIKSDIYHSYYYIYYLITKYNNLIIPINKDDINNIEDEYFLYANSNLYNVIIKNNYKFLFYINIKYISNTNKILYPIDLDKKILYTIEHYKKQYIIIFIHIINIYGGHANLILIDNIKKLIIFYEPHGYNYYNDKLYDNLEIYFNQFLKNYKCIKPKEYNAIISGLQELDNFNQFNTMYDIEGYCLIWSIWFIELYINNSNYELNELFNKTIKKIINMNIFITNYIKNYSDNLYKKMLKFLKKYNYDFYEKYNLSFNYKELKISNNKKHNKNLEYYDLYNEEEYDKKMLNLINDKFNEYILKINN